MTRIKLGFLCGVIAAALFLIGDAILGSEEALFNAENDPDGFAAVLQSGAFSFWALRGIIGVILEAVFAIALWHFLSRTPWEVWAWWGAVLSITGDFFGMVLFGVSYFVAPQLGAEIAAGQVSLVSVATPPPVILIGNAIPTFIGLFLSVYAIWRSNLLPKWAAGMWLVGMLMVPVQVLPVQLAASGLWMVAGIGFLAAVLQRTEIPES